MNTAADNRFPSRYWILLILLAAAVLRILGIWHGYPHAWSDEFMVIWHRRTSRAPPFLSPCYFLSTVCSFCSGWRPTGGVRQKDLQLNTCAQLHIW